MHPRFHLLAALACAWLAGLGYVVAIACLYGGLPAPRDPLLAELWMLALLLLGFTLGTILIGGVVGFVMVRLLEALRLGGLIHFFIASLLVGSAIGVAGAVFFLVCVSEPEPRSFSGELSFTAPWALLMSVVGFLAYWRFSHHASLKA